MYTYVTDICSHMHMKLCNCTREGRRARGVTVLQMGPNSRELDGIQPWPPKQVRTYKGEKWQWHIKDWLHVSSFYSPPSRRMQFLYIVIREQKKKTCTPCGGPATCYNVKVGPFTVIRFSSEVGPVVMLCRPVLQLRTSYKWTEFKFVCSDLETYGRYPIQNSLYWPRFLVQNFKSRKKHCSKQVGLNARSIIIYVTNKI